MAAARFVASQQCRSSSDELGTAADLRAAWGKNHQLIQPEVVGNGRGVELI